MILKKQPNFCLKNLKEKGKTMKNSFFIYLFKKHAEKLINKFFAPKHTIISVGQKIEKGLLDKTISLRKSTHTKKRRKNPYNSKPKKGELVPKSKAH